MVRGAVVREGDEGQWVGERKRERNQQRMFVCNCCCYATRKIRHVFELHTIPLSHTRQGTPGQHVKQTIEVNNIVYTVVYTQTHTHVYIFI